MKLVNLILNLFEKYKTLIQFGIVGVINTAVSFVTFKLLYSTFNVFDILISNTFAYIVGVANSFILNSLWTFKKTQSNKKKTYQFIQFFTVNLIAFGSQQLVLFIFATKLGFPGEIIWFAGVVFSLSINYLGSKLWVFRHKTSTSNLS